MKTARNEACADFKGPPLPVKGQMVTLRVSGVVRRCGAVWRSATNPEIARVYIPSIEMWLPAEAIIFSTPTVRYVGPQRLAESDPPKCSKGWETRCRHSEGLTCACACMGKNHGTARRQT